MHNGGHYVALISIINMYYVIYNIAEYSAIFCKGPITKVQNFLRAGHSCKT